jgi:hypothetical protein
MERRETQEIVKVIQKHRLELVSRNKVRRTGVGFKIKDGKITDEVAIIIFVRAKPSIQALAEQQIEPVPKEIEGYKTDIINVPLGFVPRVSRLLITAAMPDDLRHRPFSGGMAIINATGVPGTGTLGLIVQKSTSSADKLYLITNNHVAANEDLEGQEPPAARTGDPIIQPGAHGGGQVPQDIIAKLDDWNRLKPSGPGNVNFYDFAMAEIVNESMSDAKAYEIMDIGPVKGMEDINLGDKVMKRGRTTRKTTGRVVAVAVETTVDYQGFPCNFIDQVVITGIPETIPFSLAGDSGSCIVSSDPPHRAKALLYAGGTGEGGIDFTVASPIKKIAEDFNLKI